MPDSHHDAINSARVEEVLADHRLAVYKRTDRLFAWLMGAQWLFAIGLALVISPYAWEGKVRSTHIHVYAAVLLGGAISSLPIFLTLKYPGWVVTRNVVAIAQMLWSGLLIHLSGGRIETHFHVFCSLAFLSFYRDYRVLIPATVVVATDHFLRGVFWPESVYGIANPEWWRFLEHAGWVVLEDIVLVIACLDSVREMRDMARQHTVVEALSESEQAKSLALDEALKGSQGALARAERLAALGQLAASVGHELRNPLSAIRNANTFIEKRVGENPAIDPRVPQFLTLIDREVAACIGIISDLLDFAGDRKPVLQPCPLRPLVDEAVSMVVSGKARVVNAVPDDLAVPELDKGQFRQVFINLVQNAVDALPPERDGEVVIHAEGGGSRPFCIVVKDNGVGISADAVAKIFEPLFTTKTKGTGLGLAIVANLIKGHRGSIGVESEIGAGASFTIELPANVSAVAA